MADEGSVAFMSQLPYANAKCAHIVVGRDNTAAGLAPSPTRRFSLKATTTTQIYPLFPSFVIPSPKYPGISQ